MPDLLDQAIAHVRGLPPAAQDEVARLLFDWVGDRETDDRLPEPIDPDHRAAIEEGLADVRAGRIATGEEIAEAFAAFRSGR